MTLGHWFGASVAFLQGCACLAFLFQQDWKQALFWGGVALANTMVVMR